MISKSDNMCAGLIKPARRHEHNFIYTNFTDIALHKMLTFHYW
ncbi:hypothetical protein GPUN_2440 [Glaciecola punicea ACAM 611]|uniref:Uncharacterized protein n=1 Tax=Glaciecola punicea ACAM 611 TaxID=1121923 RepID=H5TE28_9ALTE|nr:hypothetical protein GPUN_2440 [Glaciecola punicea ACAM 611]